MAAFDSLLRVMSHRGAEAMSVATGQVPSLRRGGNPEPMAMPPLDAAMVAAFVEEIVPPEARDDLAARRGGEFVYRGSAGDAVAVMIELTSNGHRLVVRRHGRGAAAPAPRPAEATIPVPAPAPASASASVPVPVPVPVPASASVSDPDPDPDPASVSASITALVHLAYARKASDLLLSTGRAPRLRIDGDMVPLDDVPPPSDDELLALLGTAPAASRDFGLTIDQHRLRGHGFQHERGLGVALRLIRRDVPTVRELGLPDDLTELARLRSGLVLVAGPTGSGKSTTLVALVEHLNRSLARHIVTLEDPIEYEYQPARSLIHQREIGRHAPSFADGLRAALREAPDVIVVGELRDRETVSIALTAAETGHLVLGTMHAPGAAVAIDRLIDAFPEHQQRQARSQLAAVLRVVVTQHLLPTRTGGRVPALERVPVTAAIANLIRKNELHMLAAHIQTGRDAGMVPLEKNLARLVRAGTVDARAARALAVDHDLFEQSLRAS